MKIDELRIGNIIADIDFPMTRHIVDTIDAYSDKIWFDNGPQRPWLRSEDAIPIPLTPDIFRKIPFLKEVKDGKETYWEGPVTDKIDMRSGNHSGHLDVVFETHDCDAIKKVQYLHELQNGYYFLTGKEMEIEL